MQGFSDDPEFLRLAFVFEVVFCFLSLLGPYNLRYTVSRQ